MALNIGERIDDDMADARWRATDTTTGNPVGVRISREALQDHGVSDCLAKATEKFVDGSSGVRVTTSDFQNA